MSKRNQKEADSEEEQLCFGQPGFDTSAQIEQVHELVAQANGILSSLGPDFQRIGWLLEDAISYINELAVDQDRRKTLLAADYLGQKQGSKKKAVSE